MDRDTELRKLINVVYRTGKMAYRSQWTGGGEESARFCIEQYNRILARLRELDPEMGAVFVPLESSASLNIVAIACKQVVSYYEDEMRHRGIHIDHDPFDFGFKGRHAAAGFCIPGTGDFEDLGNMIRDWVQGWRTGTGSPKPEKPDEQPKKENQSHPGT